MALASMVLGAQFQRKPRQRYFVEAGKGRCVDWGNGFASCTSMRFDETTGRWMTPRPELGTKALEVWHQRHEADLRALSDAAAAGKCPDTLLLGDSITERWNRPSFKAKRPNFADCSNCGSAPDLRPGVLTFAIGGDRIQDLGWRLFEGGGIEALQKCSPAHIVLMIGTNDYGFGEDVESAQSELRILVQQILRTKPAGSHLVLNAIFPRGDNSLQSWGCPDWDPMLHTQLNSELQKLADSSRSTYLDCSQLVNLNVEQAYEADQLHLASKGYTEWNHCFKQASLPTVLM
jgi:lysophospholipase L1-like esterase